MAKKKKRNKKIQTGKNVRFDSKAFLSELEAQTRRIFQGMILPVEQRLDSLFENLQSVKSNVVVANTLLEKKKIFSREEYFDEFALYGQTEGVGAVDVSGQMDGNSVFSLYNCGE